MLRKDLSYTGNMLITVDTGATKTLVAGVNKGGQFSARYRFPTPKDTAEYIYKLSSLIKEHFDKEKISTISIAIPGTAKDGVAVYCGNLGWHNFPIVRDLLDALDLKVPVFLANDADLAGLSEANAITPLPETCLYITVSTGVGTGLVINGKLADLPIFEGGQIFVEYDGIIRRWEDFASGRAIYETYGRYARDIKAKAVWEQIADKIARGLLVLIPAHIPNNVVIGGSIGTHFDKYEKRLREILNHYLPDYMKNVKVSAAKHPEEAVIYGCKLYAEKQLS